MNVSRGLRQHVAVGILDGQIQSARAIAHTAPDEVIARPAAKVTGIELNALPRPNPSHISGIDGIDLLGGDSFIRQIAQCRRPASAAWKQVNGRIAGVRIAHVTPIQRDGAARRQRRQQIGRDTANPQPGEIFQIPRARNDTVAIHIPVITIRRGSVRACKGQP